MMHDLIDTLQTEQCSLVILHDGQVRTYSGHGVRRLYDIMTQEPELLYCAKLAVKAVGQSAAATMVDGGVAEVWAEYISEQAADALESAGIKVSYGKKLPHTAFLEVWGKLGE